MKMIMRCRWRWLGLPCFNLDQFVAITFFVLRFKVVKQPAFPIAKLPGILKNQEIGKQQNGYYFSQLK